MLWAVAVQGASSVILGSYASVTAAKTRLGELAQKIEALESAANAQGLSMKLAVTLQPVPMGDQQKYELVLNGNAEVVNFEAEMAIA